MGFIIVDEEYDGDQREDDESKEAMQKALSRKRSKGNNFPHCKTS